MATLVFMLALAGLMRLFPEQAPWIAAGGLALCYLRSLQREDANEKRIKALEKQLGYVTTSKRSVSEIIENVRLNGQTQRSPSDEPNR